MQQKITVLGTKAAHQRLRLLACFVLQLIVCCSALAGKGDTQNTLGKKISIEFKNIPLKEAVAKLGLCVPGISFTYVENAALNQARVNLSAKDETASQVLGQILFPLYFNYTVMQYHVVIWFDAGMAAKHANDADEPRHQKTARIAWIKGTVTNLAMDAIPNVTITVSGVAKTLAGGAMGQFVLHNIPGAATLVFAAKGYRPQQVSAKTAAEGFLLVQLAKEYGATQLQALHN